MLRGKVKFEEIGNRNAIVVTEVPYQVNKADMIERTAELVKEDKIPGFMKSVMNLTEKGFVWFMN